MPTSKPSSSLAGLASWRFKPSFSVSSVSLGFNIHASDRLLLLALFAIAFAIRLAVVLATRFDGLYGQDAYAYYDYAMTLRAAAGTGAALSPFFWPLGYPALIALAFTVLGPSALTAQGVNLVLGAALVPLVYALARVLIIARLGSVVAALSVAVCGQAIQSSVVVMSDIPALTWATLSAILLWAYTRRAQTRRLSGILIATALVLTLAIITRWVYLALIPVWLVTVRLAVHPFPLRPMLIATGAAALFALPQIAFSLTSPYPVLDHAWVRGWSPANVVSREFANVDGHFTYPQINALAYAAPLLDAYYLAPLFAPFALLGLWQIARRHPARAVFLGGWLLVPYLFLAGIPYQNIRFPLIIVPPVAIVAGAGLESAYQSASRWLVRWPHLRPLGLAILLIAGFGMTVSATQSTLGTFIANQQNDHAVAAWATRSIPAGATVYSLGLTQRLEHVAPSLDVRELYYETTTLLTRYREFETGGEAYVLVNPWVIDHQWQGRELQRVFYWLRDWQGLDEIGNLYNYHLYRIRRG